MVEELYLKKRTEEEQGKDPENLGLLPDPEPIPTSNSKSVMDAKSLRWFCGGASLLTVIGIIIGIIVALTVPADKSNDSTVPSASGTGDTADPVPRMSIQQKAIFKVSLVLTRSSDTSRRNSGTMEAFSNGRSCRTGSFDFKEGAHTEIFMADHDGCTGFKMETNNTMWVKVEKEVGADIVVYQVKVMLEDGQEYSAFFRPQQDQTSAESFPLRIQTNELKLAMYFNYKRVQPNIRKLDYVEQTKVELRLKGNSHISCHTNPLPWPSKNGTTVLRDLKYLGTCFTFDLLNITDNLEARFTGPKKGEFIVASLILRSTDLRVHASEWGTMPVKTGLPETWLTLFYID